MQAAPFARPLGGLDDELVVPLLLTPSPLLRTLLPLLPLVLLNTLLLPS